MKYSLPQELEKFDFYVDKLRKKECTIELKEIRKPRTIQQNKYLHVIISLFAIETGYTLEEMKTILKRKCDFMRYKKNDQTFLKPSSQLDTKELTDWIDWIRNLAGQAEFYLPSPDNYLRDWTELKKE
ncbi:unnamed protein product, partial [marine sediment metagenome]